MCNLNTCNCKIKSHWISLHQQLVQTRNMRMNCLHRTLGQQVHSNTLHFKVHACTLGMSPACSLCYRGEWSMQWTTVQGMVLQRRTAMRDLGQRGNLSCSNKSFRWEHCKAHSDIQCYPVVQSHIQCINWHQLKQEQSRTSATKPKMNWRR